METSNLLLLTFVLASCVLLNFAASARIFKPDCTGEPNGLILPDPRDCARYFVCLNERAKPKRCKIGYYFDMESYQCDLAPYVECDLKSRQSKTSKAMENPAVTEAPCIAATPCTPKPASCTPPATCSTTTCPPPTPCSTITSPISKPVSTTTCPPPTTCSITNSKPLTHCSTTFCPPPKPCSTTISPTSKPVSTTNVPPATPCSTTTVPPAIPCSTTTSPTLKPVSTTTISPAAPCSTTTVSPATPWSTTTCPTPTPCSTTTCPPPTETLPNRELNKLHIMRRKSSDCKSLPDGTFLVDKNQCRKYYVCQGKKTKAQKCKLGEFFDYELGECGPKSEVKNCIANH